MTRFGNNILDAAATARYTNVRLAVQLPEDDEEEDNDEADNIPTIPPQFAANVQIFFPFASLSFVFCSFCAVKNRAVY